MRTSRHSFFLLTVLAIVAVLRSSDAAYQHSIKLNSQYTFSWTLFPDHIEAEMVVSAISWIGFGLSPIASFGIHGMPYADFTIAIFNGTVLHVDDYYRNSAFPGQPSKDTELGGQNNILVFSGYQNGTHSVVSFVRPLSTGDKFDSDFSQGNNYIIFAWGQSNTFAFHGFLQNGMTSINFNTGDIIPLNK